MNERARPKGRRLDITCPPGLELRSVRGKGRGVFAPRRFRKGEVLERSPVLAMTERQWRHVAKTLLDHYVYEWDGKGGCAMVLGLGSLYNHSYEPNVANLIDRRNGSMDWVALRTIAKGEEITVNYNDEDDPLSDLWFEAK
jgi:uncharacterized protein